ncbi:MAG: hypothetical protein AB7H70_09215 [Rhodospirillaceae bacterium]
MSDTSNGGGNNGLYFIVGGLVVIVGLGAFLFFGNANRSGTSATGGSSTTIERTITPDGSSTTIKKD